MGIFFLSVEYVGHLSAVVERVSENRVFKMEPTLFIEKDEPKMKKSLLKNLLWNWILGTRSATK